MMVFPRFINRVLTLSSINRQLDRTAYNKSYIGNIEISDDNKEKTIVPTIILAIEKDLFKSLIVSSSSDLISLLVTSNVKINVVDDDLNPINNSTIILTGAGVDVAPVFTGNDGNVTVPVYPRESGIVHILAKKPGYTSSETNIRVVSKNNTTPITTNSSDQNNPSISGNSIVWKDKRNGNWDIYMYDLSTNTEKQITTNTTNQLYPIISENRIVWEDKRNSNSDIYMYDLSTSTEKQITTNSAHQWYPDISGNRIVWQDKRNGNWDIYMTDLSI